MINYTIGDHEPEEFVYKELTKIQREYVDKLYKRERGQSAETIGKKYRSVIFGKYTFVVGDDPFGLQADWPESERMPR